MNIYQPLMGRKINSEKKFREETYIIIKLKIILSIWNNN